VLGLRNERVYKACINKPLYMHKVLHIWDRSRLESALTTIPAQRVRPAQKNKNTWHRTYFRFHSFVRSVNGHRTVKAGPKVLSQVIVTNDDGALGT